MKNPFYSGTPFVSPSLNRIRIVELPGTTLPAHIEGQNGFDLLSSEALKRLISHRAEALGLAAAEVDLKAFNACFSSSTARVQSEAEAIAREYGERLGYLLLVLKRGDAANRRAREDWGPRHWDWWGGMETIWLAGGLVSGQLGPRAALAAQRIARTAGLEVRLAPHPAYLPLIGVARLAPVESKVVLVIDFGHTSVKRAAATYTVGKVVGLRLLPTIDSPCRSDSAAGNRDQEEADRALQNRGERLVTIAAESWRKVSLKHRDVSQTVLVSLATYLFQGHPIGTYEGCYADLRALAENLEAYCSAQLSEALAQKMRVILSHDGTAAATAFAGDTRTAVVMLGTAMGIGFPPRRMDIRSVAGEGGNLLHLTYA